MSKDVRPASDATLSMTAVAALLIGVLAVGLEVYVDPPFKPLAAIAGAAAIITGALAIVNARRAHLTGSWMAYIAIALGVVALIMFVVWFLSPR